ncbi:MAG: ABC transporter substrate-binding protein [Phycisphaerales bacterium]|nr:MAG: ABC transporter substrate-binding protein [Phycisphaerales bacterium]
MRSLWYALLVLLLAGQGIGAENEDPNDPVELLQSKWDAVISILQAKDIDAEAKAKKIDKLVSPTFDFPLMAKLTLGRKNWPKLTQPQREEFTKLFVERLKTSYRERITLYTDERVAFKPAVRKKTTVQVPMELISKEESVEMLYKLRLVDKTRKVKVGERWEVKVYKRWKIYDLEIQGVSILLTYRSQFDDILSSGTVEDLLSRLQKPPTS